MQTQQTNWEGSIPVVISLAPGDSAVASYQVPAPVYAMVPRRGYLVPLVQGAVDAFGSSVVPMAGTRSNVWFSTTEDVPLKWWVHA